MRRLRVVVLLVSIMLIAVISGGLASAAPGNAPEAATFDLACDNGETYSIVTNGQGPFTPGHITSSGGAVLIPVEIDVTGTFNGDVVFHELDTKTGQMTGLQDDLMTCTFAFSEVDPSTGDTFAVSGSAVVFLAPRH